MNDYNSQNNNENEINEVKEVKKEENASAPERSQSSEPVYQSYQSYQSYNDVNQNEQNKNDSQGSYYYTQTPTPPPQQAYEFAREPQTKKPNDTFGAISFCLALSFIVMFMCRCCCFPLMFVFLSLIFALEVAAIVFACISKQKMGKFTGLARAGMIIAIIVLVIMVSAIAFVTVEYLLNPDYYTELLRSFTEQGYYVEFFEKYEPEFYAENKDEIDRYFGDYFSKITE